MPTVTDRFFEAFDAIWVRDAVSIREFCRELGVDRRNFLKQRDDHSRCILKPEWLTFLVERYGGRFGVASDRARSDVLK